MSKVLTNSELGDRMTRFCPAYALVVCQVDGRDELPLSEIARDAASEAVVAHLDDVKVAVPIQGGERSRQIIVGQLDGDKGLALSCALGQHEHQHEHQASMNSLTLIYLFSSKKMRALIDKLYPPKYPPRYLPYILYLPAAVNSRIQTCQQVMSREDCFSPYLPCCFLLCQNQLSIQ